MTIVIDDTNANDFFVDILTEIRDHHRAIDVLRDKQWKIVQYGYRKKILDKREYEVLKLRYALGYQNWKPKTLEEVGKAMKITRERVRQIDGKALNKLYQIHGSEVWEFVK